jgi:hypothetical protein
MDPFQPPPSQNGYHAPQQAMDMGQYPSANAWRQFADHTMTNMVGSEYMTSATALMSLGADKQHMAPMGGMQMLPSDDPTAHWPLSQYQPQYQMHPNGQMG